MPSSSTFNARRFHPPQGTGAGLISLAPCRPELKQHMYVCAKIKMKHLVHCDISLVLCSITSISTTQAQA